MEEGGGLGPASTDKPDFVVSQKEALPFMRSGLGMGKGRERKLGLICKIKNLNKKRKFTLRDTKTSASRLRC